MRHMPHIGIVYYVKITGVSDLMNRTLVSYGQWRVYLFCAKKEKRSSCDNILNLFLYWLIVTI